MAVELLPVDILVGTAAVERGIAAQVLDAGKRRHRRQKPRRHQVVVELGIKRTDLLDTADDGFAAIFTELVAGIFAVEWREIPQRRLRRSLRKEIVDADMLERPRGLK